MNAWSVVTPHTFTLPNITMYIVMYNELNTVLYNKLYPVLYNELYTVLYNKLCPGTYVAGWLAVDSQGLKKVLSKF